MLRNGVTAGGDDGSPRAAARSSAWHADCTTTPPANNRRIHDAASPSPPPPAPELPAPRPGARQPGRAPRRCGGPVRRRQPARGGDHHRRAAHREHPAGARLGQRAARRDPGSHQHQRPGRARHLGTRAQPEHRIQLRPRLPALLHPRLRQHRLPAQRLAAGEPGLRRRGAGEPHPEGLPGLRPRAHRGAAGPAGFAVRPQHAGRRGEVRFGQAGQEGRGLRQHLAGHLHHRERRGRRHDPVLRQRVGAHLGAEPDAQGLGGQHLRARPDARVRGLPRQRAARPAARGAEGSAPSSACTGATTSARRACSAPTSSSRAPTTSFPASIAPRLPSTA